MTEMAASGFVSLHDLIAVVGIVFVAALVRSTFGFGDALVAMPLLLLAEFDHLAAVALLAATSLVTASVILAIDGSGREPVASSARILIGSALPGLGLGLWFLEVASVSRVSGVLGGTILVVGVLGVMADPRRWPMRSWSAALFGLLAGALGGAFNVHGPPLVVFGTSREWSPRVFRSTFQVYFLAVGLPLVLVHGLSGRYSTTVVLQLVACLPVIGLASFLGGRLNRKFAVTSFRRSVYAMLIGLGIVLLWKAGG